jgi:hypothetical protein
MSKPSLGTKMRDKKLMNIKDFSIVFLTIAVFIFLLLKINLYELAGLFKNMNLFIIAISFFISIFSNFILASNLWRMILKFINYEISFSESLFIRISTYSLRILLPFKSGEFLKALYIKKHKNVPLLKGICSVAFNIILNFLIILSLFLVGYTFILFNLKNVIILLLSSLFLSFIFIILLNQIKNILFKLTNKFKRSKRLFLEISSFFNISKSRQFFLLLHSLVIQLTILMNYCLIAKSFNIEVPFYMILTFFSLIMIITLIPVTVSGIGLREILVILFFSNFASYEKLIGWGIMVSFIDYLAPALIGSLFFKRFLGKIT